MYARFFGSNKQAKEVSSQSQIKLSRFESCVHFKQILPLLVQLENKKKELDEARNMYGTGTPDFEKYTVITDLLLRIGVEMNCFNHDQSNPDEYEEAKASLVLAKKMLDIVSKILDKDGSVLSRPRNNYKTNVNTAVIAGAAVVSAISTVVMGTSAVPKLAASMVSGSFVGEYFCDATGLNSSRTKSTELVSDLKKILSSIAANLEDYVKRLEIPLLMKKTVSQRTWGAIGLYANDIYKGLPKEIKNIILSQIKSGHEKPEYLNNINKYNGNLLNAAEQMVQSHSKKS